MMHSDDDKDTCVYRIDDKDRLIFVNAHWRDFAIENGGADSCLAGSVLGRSLWHFVSDHQVVHLYKILVEKVRVKRSPLTVPIRCDSPDKRRLIDVTLNPQPADCVEFNCRTRRIEPRKPVLLLDSGMDRSDVLVRICSFCKKIAVSDTVWADTEEAIRILDLFGSDSLPGLTHGMCPGCYAAVMAEINDSEVYPAA